MFDRCLFDKRYPLDRWSAQYRLPSPKLAQQLRIKSGNLNRRTAIGYEKYMYANQSNKGCERLETETEIMGSIPVQA